MTEKFVCVFDKEAKDLLLLQGFIPVKLDEKNNIFVFYNQEPKSLIFSDIRYLFTNTITF